MTSAILQNITDLVGTPQSFWVGDQWIPAKGSRLYTTDEIRILFSNECTLFVGDSLQRRAADTLHIMLTTTSGDISNRSSHDVRGDVFSPYFFNNKVHDRGYKERYIEPSQEEKTSPMGCIATDWQPTLANVAEFSRAYQNDTEGKYAKYTVVVVGSTIWDAVGGRGFFTSPNSVRASVNLSIHELYDNLPESVLMVWKSSGWCYNCPWTVDETKATRVGDNYKVWAANEQAKASIESLNASNFVFLDWGREILPRSLGDIRLKSDDNNPYHYSLPPRLQFLQMLSEVYDKRSPHLLSPSNKTIVPALPDHFDMLGAVSFLNNFLIVLVILGVCAHRAGLFRREHNV